MATSYDFPDHRKGDTMEAITFTLTVNGDPLDLTDASVRMDLRKGSAKIARYTSGGGGLTIVAPATGGVLQFDEQVIDLPAETYTYDIEFTLSDGSIKTYIIGTFKIIQDITYD